MNLLKSSILSISTLVIGLYLGSIWGLQKGGFNTALEENKIAKGLLTNTDLELTPEFTEYLKSRIYYNIASKYPNDRGYLLRKDWDCGEVQRTRLPFKSGGKDPTYEYNSFEAATKHLTNAERIETQ